MTVEEKKKLGTALTRLSPEDLTRALEIVADDNPSFQATAEVVDLDMDAQVAISILTFANSLKNIILLYSWFINYIWSTMLLRITLVSYSILFIFLIKCFSS